MKKVVCLALLFGCSHKTSSNEKQPAGSAAPTTPPAGQADAAAAPGADPGAPPAATAAAATARNDADDLFNVASGTLVVHEPTGVDNSVHLWRLFDSDPKTDWGVDKDVIEKDPFVIELAGRATIDTFVIDAASIELPERLPGKIKIEVSDQSATAGFELVAELAPKQPAADGMVFPATKKSTGRFVRVTFYDANPDDTTQQDIANLHAYGTWVSKDPAPANVTGTYETDNGHVSLRQTGTSVTGCRTNAKAPILGGFEGRVLKWNWPDNGDGFEGPAVAVFGKEHIWAGYWATKLETPSLGEILFVKKLSDKPEPCPDDKKDPIATALEQGRVRLYGINFDTDSDHLKDESRATLDAVKKTLDAHADWKVTIEGHTDSTSTHDHNQGLSDKRAAAVKAYLVKAGIAADRLDTAGLAETKPVAPNTDALGRAQNRRVELVRH